MTCSVVDLLFGWLVGGNCIVVELEGGRSDVEAWLGG